MFQVHACPRKIRIEFTTFQNMTLTEAKRQFLNHLIFFEIGYGMGLKRNIKNAEDGDLVKALSLTTMLSSI